MTATVYFIDNLRRRRRMIEAGKREQLAQQIKNNRLSQILSGEPDDTPPGGRAA